MAAFSGLGYEGTVLHYNYHEASLLKVWAMLTHLTVFIHIAVLVKRV